MKNENFLVYHREDHCNDDKHSEMDVVLQDLEEKVTAVGKSVTGPAVSLQNGHIPNNNQGQHLRYDVRNMYAQIGSYPPNDSVL